MVHYPVLLLWGSMITINLKCFVLRSAVSYPYDVGYATTSPSTPVQDFNLYYAQHGHPYPWNHDHNYQCKLI
jgi:hypothetical protein